jgi:hypothetical protein
VSEDTATKKPESDTEKSTKPSPGRSEASHDGGPDGGAPPSRDEALHRLRGDAAELSSVRFGKIISEGIDRLDGVTNVNVFQGQFAVEGDFLAGPRGRTSSRGSASRRTAKIQIDPKTIEELSAYFVPAAGFESGVSMVNGNNLLLLSGPARTGRRTRALATLVEVMRRAELGPEIFELTGDVLGNMTWRVPRERCGLIVIDRPRGQHTFAAESISDDWLTYAADRLSEHCSFMVVVTGPVRGSLATAPKRPDFVLEELELPDPIEIVRKRVLGTVPWLSEEELDRRLGQTLLAEILDERDDPAFAARAAAGVAEVLRVDGDLAGVVAGLRNHDEQVSEWLATDPDQADIAFVLATAALEGSTYLNVADAAVALYRELASGLATVSPRYLRKLMSERTWIEYVAQPGDPAAPLVVRFRHSRLRPAVLGLSWFELDGARAKILQWLTKLAGHADVEVRARAAGAAGILASNDFEHGLHSYLMPWSDAKPATLRQSAALGLNVVGNVGDHTEAVWSHIERWAHLDGYDEHTSSNLPATAALAVGGPLGVENPRRALRVLRTLVCNGHWGLMEPAALSTHLLLEAGRIDEVLDALKEWTEPATDEEPVVKALTMFAFAAGEEGSGETGSEQPVLLPSAWKHRDTLPELWGRALSCEPVRPLAMWALREWVRAADTDPNARGVVLDMLAGIADRSDDDFGRMRHALHGWAEDPDDPSDAAADFYNDLVEAGDLTE